MLLEAGSGCAWMRCDSSRISPRASFDGLGDARLDVGMRRRGLDGGQGGHSVSWATVAFATAYRNADRTLRKRAATPQPSQPDRPADAAYRSAESVASATTARRS
jgi:hypothetical protein